MPLKQRCSPKFSWPTTSKGSRAFGKSYRILPAIKASNEAVSNKLTPLEIKEKNSILDRDLSPGLYLFVLML